MYTQINYFIFILLKIPSQVELLSPLPNSMRESDCSCRQKFASNALTGGWP